MPSETTGTPPADADVLGWAARECLANAPKAQAGGQDGVAVGPGFVIPTALLIELAAAVLAKVILGCVAKTPKQFRDAAVGARGTFGFVTRRRVRKAVAEVVDRQDRAAFNLLAAPGGWTDGQRATLRAFGEIRANRAGLEEFLADRVLAGAAGASEYDLGRVMKAVRDGEGG